MKLKDFLLNEAKIGEIIVFREAGYQIGMTRIDNERLYISSLSDPMLELYDVVCYTHEKREWATRDVLVVDIAPTYSRPIVERKYSENGVLLEEKYYTGADHDGEL